MQDTHDSDVAAIASKVKDLYSRKVPFRVFHGSTNSTRILSFKHSEMVDVSNLDNVLAIRPDSMTADVEPNVPMDKLVFATLQYGLVPAVVMEFPGITVGGGIQGGAGESSSFKYGCFNQICNSYEMVLADGTIVTASQRERSDLFYGTAGSFGTLGIITKAEIQLLPAKKFVQLTYLPVTGFEDAVQVLQEVAAQDYDYIDGIMFSATNGVIIVGRLSDKKTGNIQRFSSARDNWYYLHAQDISAAHKEVTESVPLVDYLFRYDRGAFWVGRYAFELFGVEFNRFYRWLLNPILHTRKLYQALQESGASQQYLVQDLALPLKQAANFMQFVDKEFAIYPMWLCPLAADNKSPLQSNNLKTPLVINVGVWGNRITDPDTFIAVNKQLEGQLALLGGKKWFYAHSYYTEQEFWSRYDKRWYDKLRSTYKATNLPNVYDKIHVKETYPVDLKRGVWRTIFGRAKLRVET